MRKVLLGFSKNVLFQAFSLLACISNVAGQNIFSGEPVQVVGQMNAYSTAASSNSTYRRVSVSSGTPVDGRGQWFKTYNVQSSGGDFTPINMTGGGSNGFLFISGPNTNRFQNKWVFTGVGQAAVNAINNNSAYNSGNDMGLNMSTAGYYSFVFNDVGYTVTNAKFYVARTTNTPVTVTRGSETLNFNRSATVAITTSATPSTGENVYVRYTTGADFSSTSSTTIVQATGSGTSWTATIPAQTIGSTVRYYIFTSTIDLTTLNGMSEIDKSMSVLNYADNAGNNFSYTLTSTFTSSTTGNFSSAATWGGNQPFAGASYTVANTHTVTVDADASIVGLTVNTGGNVAVSDTRTLTTSGTVTVNGTLNVEAGGTLAVAGGTVTTNNNIVFKSSATGTGRLAYTSGTITGNVTVERFIVSKSDRKSIFLASPVSQTISSAWQQQIHITGAGTGGTVCPTLTAHTNGFDATLTNAPSMFTYNHAAGSGNRWQSIANTNSTSLTPGVGYRVIVRGPRSAGCSLLDGSTNAQAVVTLSATGAPQTGNVSATIAGSNGFSLVGNPYISAIDWNNSTWVTDRGTNGIAGSYWLYNPANAAGTYSVYNGVTMTNQGTITNPNIIGIGQSFFVQKTSAGDGAISTFFKPAYQVATNQAGAFRTANTWIGQVRVKMFVAGAPTATDEVILLYGNGNSVSNNSLGSFDAVTLNQGAVNMIASYKNADLLAINTREQLSTVTNDTIQLFTQNADGNYSLTVTELNTLPYEAFLIDAFNNNVISLQSQPSYNYTVTSDPATKGNRFKIVFRTAGTLPVSFLNINAASKAGSNTIHWTVAQSNAAAYVVERSANGRNFTEIAKLNASNATSYSYVDVINTNATQYYRVKAVAANGAFKYSSVVKVNGEASIDLSLYPNPVQNTLKVQLGQQVKGQVNLRIVDSKGTVVLERSGLYPANTNFLQVEVGHLPYGKYLLQLTNGADFVASGSFVK